MCINHTLHRRFFPKCVIEMVARVGRFYVETEKVCDGYYMCIFHDCNSDAVLCSDVSEHSPTYIEEMEFLLRYIGLGDVEPVAPVRLTMFQAGDFQPDFIDRNIARDRIDKRERICGARVGDFIYLKEGGWVRIAHIYSDCYSVCGGDWSFHLGEGGFVTFSGACSGTIKNIIKTDDYVVGDFWVEHHGVFGGGCGVGVRTKCRTYQEM